MKRAKFSESKTSPPPPDIPKQILAHGILPFVEMAERFAVLAKVSTAWRAAVQTTPRHSKAYWQWCKKYAVSARSRPAYVHNQGCIGHVVLEQPGGNPFVYFADTPKPRVLFWMFVYKLGVTGDPDSVVLYEQFLFPLERVALDRNFYPNENRCINCDRLVSKAAEEWPSSDKFLDNPGTLFTFWHRKCGLHLQAKANPQLDQIGYPLCYQCQRVKPFRFTRSLAPADSSSSDSE